MPDILPTVEGDAGPREVLPVMLFGADGQAVSASSGLSSVNSTQTPLGADEAFAGGWEVTANDHTAINVIADQDGEVLIEFAIVKDGADPANLTDADVIVTASLPQTIYANRGYYRPLIKGGGRAMRVRYTNGPIAQTQFALLTQFGDNLFPPSVSEKNELRVTNLAAERADFAAYGLQDITATSYAVLADLSDTVNFPHDEAGAIILTGAYITVDRGNNTVGAVQIGTVIRIDGTDADIHYVQGVSFRQSADTTITRDRALYPNSINTRVTDGKLARVASSFIETTTALNTGITLPSTVRSGGAALQVTPEVGDLVVKFGYTSGAAFSPSASVSYYTER